MNKIYLVLFLPFVCSSLIKAQITTDYNAPNNNPVHLIDNVLLGGGVIASNHAYQGDRCKLIFNGINSNIGLDSVVLPTGDTSVLDPNFLVLEVLHWRCYRSRPIKRSQFCATTHWSNFYSGVY